jgi:flagellar basal-body rod modification protein FlgD
MVDAVAAGASRTSNVNAQSVKDSSAEASAMLSSDFETFLRMMTAQVQNQDPLNPVDSSDYATQLATFSSVEQQVLTNDLLRGMASALTGNVLQQASSWIGMDALARAPVVYDGATPVTIRPDYAEGADAAQLVVRDAEGEIVQSFDIADTPKEVVWTGVGEDGTPLPAGIYKLEVNSYEGETLLEGITPQAFTRITEIRSEGEQILVRLADGTEVPSGLVSGLRQPRA